MGFETKYNKILIFSIGLFLVGIFIGYNVNNIFINSYHKKDIIKKLDNNKYKLFVIAHQDEVDIKKFDIKLKIDKNIYLTNVGFLMYSGVGKLETTYNLTKFLLNYKNNISDVFNIGTAGGTKNNQFGDIVECNKFIQADFKIRNKVIKKKNMYLKKNNNYTCLSQDKFVLEAQQPQNVVFEMEAFANASVLQNFGMLDKFYSIKIISDIVGNNVYHDWDKDVKILNSILVDKIKEIAGSK